MEYTYIYIYTYTCDTPPIPKLWATLSLIRVRPLVVASLKQRRLPHFWLLKLLNLGLTGCLLAQGSPWFLFAWFFKMHGNCWEMLAEPTFSMICLSGIMETIGFTNNFHDSGNYGSGSRGFSKFTEIVGNYW